MSEFQYHRPESLEEASDDVRARVEGARTIQQSRYAGTALVCNAELNPGSLETFCVVDEESTAMLRLAVDRLQLTARAYHRVLKLARSIADLETVEHIQVTHVAEALQYRTPSNAYMPAG